MIAVSVLRKFLIFLGMISVFSLTLVGTNLRAEEALALKGETPTLKPVKKQKGPSSTKNRKKNQEAHRLQTLRDLQGSRQAGPQI